jgi:hypothetical protein
MSKAITIGNISKRFISLKAKSDKLSAEVVSLNGKMAAELKRAHSFMLKSEKAAETKSKNAKSVKNKKKKIVRVHSFNRAIPA